MTTVIERPTAPETRPGTQRRKTRVWGDGERQMSPWLALLIQLVIIGGFLAIWQWAADQGKVDTLTFGSPKGVWEGLRSYVPSDQAHESFKQTGLAVFLAFTIGSTLGTIAGLVLGISRNADAVFGPFMGPLNSIPRIALAPVFIAWFGLTTQAKVVLAVTVVFFILAENARSAVRSVDPDITTMARVVGLKGPAMLWKVVLPSAVPTMFAGLRLAFTFSLLGVVASEMIAASSGIGTDIVQFSTSYQINTVYAILVLIALFSVVVNALLLRLERRLLRWQ
jgi:NitT/TauT family transport system permease protein